MRCVLCLVAGLWCASASGQVSFFDDFENGPSSQWGNERGAWVAQSGVYFATQPSNNPTTYTLLPYAELGDLDIRVDVKRIGDGGVWLHSNADRSNAVLLVMAGSGGSYRGFYWHDVRNGNYGPGLNHSGQPLFELGTDHTLRITVRGNTYAVYLDDATTPATTLTTNQHPQGRVGLYDFSQNLEFDNFDLRSFCRGDFNHDGQVDFFDYLDFVQALSNEDPSADFNGDGQVDFFDYLDFVQALDEGC